MASSIHSQVREVVDVLVLALLRAIDGVRLQSGIGELGRAVEFNGIGHTLDTHVVADPVSITSPDEDLNS